MSFAEHVHAVTGSCAQTIYALRILRAHGMDDNVLQSIYRTFVIGKLTYASSACWWGFTSAADRQRRLDTFIRLGGRSRSVPTDLPEFADSVSIYQLMKSCFREVTVNCDHALHCLLPSVVLCHVDYFCNQ